jgi:hypothetical protein
MQKRSGSTIPEWAVLLAPLVVTALFLGLIAWLG